MVLKKLSSAKFPYLELCNSNTLDTTIKKTATLSNSGFFIIYMSCPKIAIHKKYPYGKTLRKPLYKAHTKRLHYVF
jgi:hypothetical protein